MALFLQLLANGLVQGALVACLAAGFGFTYRALRVFHVAMGAEFVVASYAFYLAAAIWRLPPFLAVSVAILATMAFAVLIEVAVYRPFAAKGCAGGVTMVASLGVLIVTENVVAFFFGNEVKTIPHALPAVVSCGGVSLTVLQVAEAGVSALLFLAVGLAVSRSRHVKAVWALGDEPELVRALNMPYRSIRLLVALIGALLIAVPALLVSADTGMEPHEGMRWLLIASVAAFFGGRDQYWAWGAGALVLGVAQAIAVWQFPACWADTVAFALLLVVMTLRPHGLFGAAKRPEETT